MSLTTDPKDPRLTRGVDKEKGPQADVYLVLSDEERAKGFVRPVRTKYLHVGLKKPETLLPLTEAQHLEWGWAGYVGYEKYPESESPKVGRFWTQEQLDNHGCGAETTMALPLAETYARDPHFYGATYCVGCQMHLPIEEFVWSDDGTRLGS